MGWPAAGGDRALPPRPPGRWRKNSGGGGLPCLTATHDVENPASGRVMEKLGMTYRYSYVEQWQPKDLRVTFRLYQLDLDGQERPAYPGYWDTHPEHWVEEIGRDQT